MVMGETAGVDALHGQVGVSGCQRDEDGGGAVAVDMAGDDESSMFCSDHFPALPEFTCISSSSSASLPPCSTSSSSGSSSWAVVKADVDDGGENVAVAPGPALEEVVEEEVAEMDVLGELGGMAILDDTDMWDPDSLFPGDDGEASYAGAPADGGYAVMAGGGGGGSLEDALKPSEDLAMVFFEWLKSNRELISPEDLRSIKLKRSTIESAAKRLGGGREGLKKLLKLILTWVQDHHLQRKHNSYGCYQSSHPNHLHSFPTFDAQPDVWSNSNQHYHGFSDSSQPGYAQAMGGYGGGGQGMVVNGGGGFCTNYNNAAAMIDPNNMSWSSPPQAYSSPAYGNSCFSDPSIAPCMGFSGGAGSGGGLLGERFVRLGPSATKEARKKRMARQRRIFTHHHHHRHHHHHHQTQHSPRIAGEQNCTSNNNTWVGGYPSSSSISASTPTSEAVAGAGMRADSPVASQPRQAPLDRSRQVGI